MQSNEIVTDYGWNEPTTAAHKYLLKTLKSVLTNMNVSKNANILDAGCGGGYVMSDLYKIGYINIWGFDRSESGIKIARENFSELKDRFEICDVYNQKLPVAFQQGGYDIILSTEVIEHLYNPKAYLRNINDWMKQGGYLIITTPYHGYFKNIVVPLLNGFDKHVNPLWEGGHIKFFSFNTLSHILNETGFKILEFRGSGRVPYLWKSMVVVAQKV